jgi:DNA polymerase-3 subunit beta
MENSAMDVIIETKSLVHALSFANSIIEKRNAIAELANIKLSVKNNLLELIATNMDLYLTQTLGVQEFASGETTVSINTLIDIVKKIPDKEIKLNVDPETDRLEIKGANCYFSLLTLSVEKFPSMSEINSQSTLKLNCRALAQLIEYTLVSISQDEARYNLNGIYLHVKDGQLIATSLDGHRLSNASISIEDTAPEFGVILPKKTAEEILKIIKDNKNIQSDIEILLSTNKIKFVCNNIIMVSKLIDGVFPDYSDFIPLYNHNILSINTKLFAEVIERISAITMDNFRAIKIIITRESIEVTASGESRGMAKEVILASEQEENYYNFDSDSEIEIGFNPQYLTDVFNVIKSSQNKVIIHLNDESSPIVIKTMENISAIFVIMPVKV